ncbi:MAG: stage V sporulation protein AA [Lachnospirales bacterium]
MDIYIKPEKKIITSKLGKVKIKDVAKVYVDDTSLLKHINNLTVLSIKDNNNKCYLITVIDIINIINNSAKEIQYQM